jgi:hypothetical protein
MAGNDPIHLILSFAAKTATDAFGVFMSWHMLTGSSYPV